MIRRATWLLLLSVTAAPATGAADELTVKCPDAKLGLWCSQLVRFFVGPIKSSGPVTFDFKHTTVALHNWEQEPMAVAPSTTPVEFRVTGPPWEGKYNLRVSLQTGENGSLSGLRFTDEAKPDPTNPFAWITMPADPHGKPGHGVTKLVARLASEEGQREGASPIRSAQALAASEQLAEVAQDKSWRQRLPGVFMHYGVPPERVPWLTKAFASQSEATRRDAILVLYEAAAKTASRSRDVAPGATKATRAEGKEGAAGSAKP